ncbi:MAG TPA: hypothetical protein VF008_08765 [Niastella sp.]
MTKYLIILFFLTAAYTTKAQTYTVDLYDLTYKVNEAVKNGTNSHLKIDLVLENGNVISIYNRDLRQQGDQENGWRLIQPLTVSSLPVRLRTSGYVNFRSGTDADYDQYNDVGIGSVNDIYVSTHSPRMTAITYKLTIISNDLSVSTTANIGQKSVSNRISSMKP